MRSNFPWVFLLIAFMTGPACLRAIQQHHYPLAGVYGLTAAACLVLAWRNWR